jgi:hypothetical protein
MEIRSSAGPDLLAAWRCLRWGIEMTATVIQMDQSRRRHATLPVELFNAWVTYCNTVTKAWFDVFTPHL